MPPIIYLRQLNYSEEIQVQNVDYPSYYESNQICGLFRQNQSKGCTFPHIHSSPTQEVPDVPPFDLAYGSSIQLDTF